jgi:hypothetical protein
MSFISLGALVAGVTVLLGVLLDLVVTAFGGDIIAGTPNWWQEQLSLGLALLIVGLPIWLYYWGRVLRLVSGNQAERRTRSRRIFLYIVVGLAIIGLAAGLVNLIYRLLTVLFQGSSPDILRDIKWGLQAVLVALPVLIYFWQTLRQDGRAGAEAAVVTPKAVTVIARGDASGIASQLTDKLSYEVRALRYTGQEGVAVALSGPELDDIANQIQQSPGPRVMLVLINNQATVIPYSS